jgi:hypothetical protein
MLLCDIARLSRLSITVSFAGCLRVSKKACIVRSPLSRPDYTIASDMRSEIAGDWDSLTWDKCIVPSWSFATLCVFAVSASSYRGRRAREAAKGMQAHLSKSRQSRWVVSFQSQDSTREGKAAGRAERKRFKARGKTPASSKEPAGVCSNQL